MTRHYPERVRNVERLAADGDMPGLAEELLKTAITNGNQWSHDGEKVLGVVHALPPEERRRIADSLIELSNPYHLESPTRINALTLLGIIGKDLPGDPLAEERARRLEELGSEHCVRSTREALALVEAEAAAGRTPPPLAVAALRRTLLVQYWQDDPRLKKVVTALTEPLLNPGEVWSDRVLADLAGLGAADGPGGTWHALVRHALTAKTGKPTPKWEQTARALLAPLDADEVRNTLVAWLGLVGSPRAQPLLTYGYGIAPNDEYDPFNADAIRGLAWTLALLPPHPESARTLGSLVETSLRKIQGLGPRNPKVANAGVVALARAEGEASLAELSRLASRVTYKTTLKIVNAGLESRAEALGLSRDEVEELAVPAYGLTEVGHCVRRLGDCEAELTITGTKAALRWRNGAGKQVKSPPAPVKRDHADDLKELKTAVKDIDKMLSAQAERLDRQFLARREWTYDAWRERLLDHPLVGTLARRLLWTVDGTPCGYADGELRTLTDEPVKDGTTVGLWHPVGHEAAEIVAWRGWLERHGITQPFKQAHREVYLLTDAERATGTYSNRFAAHVLRQHQFNSLAAVRGWRNKLRLCVDDEYPPAVRELPRWGLRAEYWIEGIGGDAWTEDLTDAGSYLRVRTDQIRFYPIDAPENSAHAGGGEYRMWLADGREPVDPLPLEEIPELVVSEVLRDVDLFVGVASVGNDPTWQDGGPAGRFREYWTSYGFGELGPSAETRRDLIARLVPRLAIGDRCSVEGRFLHVRGERHTYKIHLGSGNVLRTPSEQYVCIVPSASGAGASVSGTGYLPFEGDRTLAVILSKAMMLARDDKITDPTILSQL
ncbi:DUF4132 domain-containing protein [Streptomyces sp. NPDC029674]|uniref:DUF4132 domain-containing protein n=1 Tax=Streptomyces sp. NPDC029674 TaxID=3365297 RepID=UPI00384C83DB